MPFKVVVFLAKITIICFNFCILAHGVISFLTLQSDMRVKRGIQRAQRQTIRRHRLQISVIEGCCFGSQSTLHNSVVGCVGVVGLGEGAIDGFKTVFDMQTLTGECVSS